MEPIENIVVLGEGEMLEFRPSFNQDVIETTSAFANTRGGRVRTACASLCAHGFKFVERVHAAVQ